MVLICAKDILNVVLKDVINLRLDIVFVNFIDVPDVHQSDVKAIKYVINVL
jgi:hypothetical protein